MQIFIVVMHRCFILKCPSNRVFLSALDKIVRKLFYRYCIFYRYKYDSYKVVEIATNEYN